MHGISKYLLRPRRKSLERLPASWPGQYAEIPTVMHLRTGSGPLTGLAEWLGVAWLPGWKVKRLLSPQSRADPPRNHSQRCVYCHAGFVVLCTPYAGPNQALGAGVVSRSPDKRKGASDGLLCKCVDRHLRTLHKDSLILWLLFFLAAILKLTSIPGQMAGRPEA